MKSNVSNHRQRLTQVPVVFAVVMLVFIGALIWLGLVLIKQDSSLSSQRTRDRLDVAASDLEQILTRQFSEENDLLSEALASQSVVEFNSDGIHPMVVDSGRTLLIIDGNDLVSYPDPSLRYFPVDRPTPPVDAQLLRADRMEFRQEDLEQASKVLIPLADSGNPALRAQALARLARIRNKQGRQKEALDLYTQLAAIDGEYVGAVPADWLGRYGRCTIFERGGQFDALASEAEALGTLLLTGRYHVNRTTYRFYATAVRDWRRSSTSDPEAAIPNEPSDIHPLSEGAAVLYQILAEVKAGHESNTGFRVAQVDTTSVVVQWATRENRLFGLSTEAHALKRVWLQEPIDALENEGIGWSVSDASGRVISGEDYRHEGMQVSRTLLTSGQPWTIRTIETAAFNSQPENRRWILFGGLILVIAIVATSTYFLTRAMRRELKLARLKSDFVSAVSHEFRTPLTSVLQLTELLSSGRVASREEAREYYDTLDREARRLSRLVESLLDFGRMEAGRFFYALNSADIGQLVDDTVTEFTDESGIDSDRISSNLEAGLICKIDRDTIRLAVWNLLDNAVKYALGNVKVIVRVYRSESYALISVQDAGIGIGEEDRRTIFGKFVRGSGSGKTDVVGSGLGLAVVKRIAEDHGGSVTVSSKLGVGSTFVLSIPLAETR